MTTRAVKMPRKEDHGHRCPAPGCVARVRFDVFACRRHWIDLSRDIRDEISASWAEGDYLAHSAARSRALAWWRR